MRPSAPRLVLILTLLVTGAASAALKPPQDFRQADEQTPEEIAASKSRTKDPITPYGAQQDEPPEPFPWMAVGLGVLALAAAAPFALRYYASVTKEINDTKTGRAARRSRNDEADA